MTKHNARNERIKREYFTHMKEAKRYSEQSVDAMAAAIHRFEAFTRFADFRQFKTQQAIDFKAYLAVQKNARTKDALSKATIYSTVNALKAFVQWLSREAGYKNKIAYRDADYFNLGRGDTAIAKAHRETRVPTMEQIRHVIFAMPHQTDIEKRNRALVAFTLMTAARDGAIASLRLKHIDLVEGKVNQDARQVDTKFSKTFVTVFCPVGDDVLQVFADWVNYLRIELLWGGDDPLFPATKVGVGASGGFEAIGLRRKGWSNAAPIRAIFRQAFAAAGLPYFNPHTFRNTLALYGMKVCKSPEEFKAWSQNIGHEDVMTTFKSYGEVSMMRQTEIIRDLGKPKEAPFDLAALVRDVAFLKEQSQI